MVARGPDARSEFRSRSRMPKTFVIGDVSVPDPARMRGVTSLGVVSSA